MWERAAPGGLTKFVGFQKIYQIVGLAQRACRKRQNFVNIWVCRSRKNILFSQPYFLSWRSNVVDWSEVASYATLKERERRERFGHRAKKALAAKDRVAPLDSHREIKPRNLRGLIILVNRRIGSHRPSFFDIGYTFWISSWTSSSQLQAFTLSFLGITVLPSFSTFSRRRTRDRRQAHPWRLFVSMTPTSTLTSCKIPRKSIQWTEHPFFQATTIRSESWTFSRRTSVTTATTAMRILRQRSMEYVKDNVETLREALCKILIPKIWRTSRTNWARIRIEFDLSYIITYLVYKS